MKEKEMKSNKPQHIRENNLEYIEFLLKKYTKLSQKELAQLSGLSIVTIKKYLKHYWKMVASKSRITVP
ncbi:hypothetical protein ACEN32_08090 [Marinilactibacillus psychrotolerans]|uniref:Helix-turn-helix type 11 domain-containing protein n=1 Tax=Marinilactibacillus psychrotolerans 42ea TaxID=1255609 RepID=A0A1R4JX57_9LACT|nr:hypothetical protein [Marinilactibacillus psychrotolerans]SJN36484.1 hypothetical protein FM115_07170 [Marinilactibacillus psychrotolerans 42ea]